MLRTGCPCLALWRLTVFKSDGEQIATWLNKGYAQKLVKAASGYWNKTAEFVMWAVNQKEAQQNAEPILSFLAWVIFLHQSLCDV